LSLSLGSTLSPESLPFGFLSIVEYTISVRVKTFQNSGFALSHLVWVHVLPFSNRVQPGTGGSGTCSNRRIGRRARCTGSPAFPASTAASLPFMASGAAYAVGSSAWISLAIVDVVDQLLQTLIVACCSILI
jgi:hypothetical protein